MRRAARLAALIWLCLVAALAPAGATLHAMSHLGPALGGPQRTHADAPADNQTGGLQHTAADHCHLCDEWQFLDHALPHVFIPGDAGPDAAPLRVAHAGWRSDTDVPWILPRAPPAAHAAFSG
ncbi:hypothetical protein CAL13_10170 [Bordetella genomosp. 9]|uniref:DUF2946 domain-containing protein n=1 Tax=Bordetella genomosp. 9 TaxID=1416803 RepID=A0A1W6Z079_9BORD|nr:hypothetical protein CAL13_10170 [Bordetella genomosp. 9]